MKVGNFVRNVHTHLTGTVTEVTSDRVNVRMHKDGQEASGIPEAFEVIKRPETVTIEQIGDLGTGPMIQVTVKGPTSRLDKHGRISGANASAWAAKNGYETAGRLSGGGSLGPDMSETRTIYAIG